MPSYQILERGGPLLAGEHPVGAAGVDRDRLAIEAGGAFGSEARRRSSRAAMGPKGLLEPRF